MRYPTDPNQHAGPRDTDLPAAARGRSSIADPRLWRWCPAAARSATSGAARALLLVGCSSQTRPHSAGQPGLAAAWGAGTLGHAGPGAPAWRPARRPLRSTSPSPLSRCVLPLCFPPSPAPPCTLARPDSPPQVFLTLKLGAVPYSSSFLVLPISHHAQSDTRALILHQLMPKTLRVLDLNLLHSARFLHGVFELCCTFLVPST